MATMVAACTASQDNFKVQPVLSFDGNSIKDSGTAEYQKGKQLLSQGRFALAAQSFQAALFAGGTSVEVLNALAVSYDKLGRYDLSDRYYQRALTLNPNNPQTVNNLAVSLAQRGAPDLAAKVLSDAHGQRPSDTTIAANLKLAQRQATAEPTATAAAVVPIPTPIAPPVPRIEQTSPSTQQLVTFGVRAAAAPHQFALAPATVNATQSPMLGASANSPSVASEQPSNAAKISPALPAHVGTVSPNSTAQKFVSTDGGRSDAGLKSIAPSLAVSRTADSVSTDEDEARPLTVSAPEIRPAIISEALAPPPVSLKAEPPDAKAIAAVPPLQAARVPPADHQTTAVPPQPASKTPAIKGLPPVTDFSKMALARSRLGSRIADSGNIQPPDIAARKSAAPEFALARLGVRVEVANGAGRRYMAARMRAFLDGRGFDVAHITNARSFDHVQTVIAYRDEYREEALNLAKSLAVKVELIRVAELPAGIRLILGSDLVAFDRTLEDGG